MADLGKVLNEMVNGRLAKTQLGGGLWLQFRTEDGTSKLCAYRIGGLGPSDVELKTLRDHLIALLPNRVIQLGEEFSYKGKDGKARLCRVFSWHTMGPSRCNWVLARSKRPLASKPLTNKGYAHE